MGKDQYELTHLNILMNLLLDEYLHGTKQINQVKTRLNQKFLRITYHSIFRSHLLYDSQLWGNLTLDTVTLCRLFKTSVYKKYNLKSVVTQITIYTRY